MRILCALTVMLGLSLAGLAESKPNFSGTWKLNLTDSRYPSKDATPARLVRTVEHDGDEMHILMDRELNGKVDKSDWGFHIGGGNPEDVVTASWDGMVLVVTLTTPKVKQVEHWKLSADGKRITDETVIERPGQETLKLLRVFDKQ